MDQPVSLASAAQRLLERVATNLSDGLHSMLDMLAQDLAASVRIYGLDNRTGAYRPIAEEELRAGIFQNGAQLLETARGAVFTLMTVHHTDFAAYMARLDRLDAGGWS